MGDVDLDLIHDTLDPPESSTQTPSRSFQPFLQVSLLRQTDRETDRPRYLVLTIGRVYVRSTGTANAIRGIPTLWSVAFPQLWPNGWMDQDATW